MLMQFLKDDTGPVVTGSGQSFYGGVTPVLKYPVSGGDPGSGPNIAPTIPGTPVPKQPKPCGNCGGGLTPIPTPPPTVAPSTPSTTPISLNQTKPTYNQLASDGAAAVSDILSEENMKADWWKYLVGAAVGYLLAKK